ncbi:MAG: hypothetical protein ACI9IP_001558 [Arcticibacterium sp.]
MISEGSIELKLSKGVDQRIHNSAQASHPVEFAKSILVLIKGIEAQSMVSEQAQAKGVKSFTDKKRIRVSYPSRSATMPLVFLTTPAEEWHVLSKDIEVRRKGFACYYDHLSNEPVILFSQDADMRETSIQIEAPEWIFGKDRSRIDVVKERCDDLEQYFAVLPYARKPTNHTEWIDDLKVVAFLQGVHWTDHVFNTYDQMGEQLEWITETVKGHQVLAFLPAWDGRYYLNYPEKDPYKRMGGNEGLKRLVEKPHRMGVKVVLMLGGPNLATSDFLKKNDMMHAELKTS